jgi:hypothetical protein
MLIQEIQANAMDLAGGELIRQKLDSDYAVLVTLNTIDSMMLELAMSPKAMRDIKSSFTLAAGTDTGTVATTSFNTDNHVVRWRRNVDDLWKIMDIVEDIEDLTRLANTGREGILFTGTLSPLTYYLSFSPSENLMAEIWGKQLAADITDLNAAPPFPPEFGTGRCLPHSRLSAQSVAYHRSAQPNAVRPGAESQFAAGTPAARLHLDLVPGKYSGPAVGIDTRQL